MSTVVGVAVCYWWLVMFELSVSGVAVLLGEVTDD